MVTLNAGCAKRLKTGRVFIGRLESDDALALVGETNERGAQPKNGAPTTTDAKPGVEECNEEIGICGREPALDLDRWDCCVVMRWEACELYVSVADLAAAAAGATLRLCKIST